uniref:Uncharacterized protein n=1 Tax=Anguilla anguilla TaxID=7936 RepID=A0A0E9S8X2_ANGAN
MFNDYSESGPQFHTSCNRCHILQCDAYFHYCTGALELT